MKVTVEYLGNLKNILNTKKPEILDLDDGSVVRDLLELLAQKYGSNFKNFVYTSGDLDLKSGFIMSVNGFLLNQLKGLNSELSEGDNIVIMPVVSGG